MKRPESARMERRLIEYRRVEFEHAALVCGTVPPIDRGHSSFSRYFVANSALMMRRTARIRG